MIPRWEHACSDCKLITQTALSDIYICTDKRITFRWGDGKERAINIHCTEVLAASAAIEQLSQYNDRYIDYGE